MVNKEHFNDQKSCGENDELKSNNESKNKMEHKDPMKYSRLTCGARDYKLQSQPSKWADSCKILQTKIEEKDMGKKDISTHVEDENHHDDDIRDNVDTQDLFKDEHEEESDIDTDTNDFKDEKDESLKRTKENLDSVKFNEIDDKAGTILGFNSSIALVPLITEGVPGCRLVYDPGGNFILIYGQRILKT